MPRSLCWKDEYTEYMHEICPGRLTPEVTRLLNEKFGTTYTKTQIGEVRRRLGLPVGKVYQGKLLTKEQHDYLVSIQKNKISRDVANEMNQKFSLSLTEKQIKSYRRNNNLHSGLTGRFEKGQTPHNKGKSTRIGHLIVVTSKKVIDLRIMYLSALSTTQQTVIRKKRLENLINGF